MGDIAIVETYRGVSIHADQPAERIETTVKPAIDRVFALGEDLKALLAFAENVTNPPEARLFAAAMIQGVYDLAIEERRARPDVDLDYVAAVVAGLDSRAFRSRTHYGTLLDARRPGEAGPIQREIPLDD